MLKKKKCLFKFFRIFFFVFVLTMLIWDHMGAKNFKTLLLPQITFESFQTFSEFSSQWSSQKYCFEFLKFWVFLYFTVFSFSLTWDPMAAKTSKRYSCLYLNFLLIGPHKSTVLDFWNFNFPIFNECFNFTIVPYEETKKTSFVWKTSDRRVKRSDIWPSVCEYSVYTGYFWHLSD